jgi:hypothetical protein
MCHGRWAQDSVELGLRAPLYSGIHKYREQERHDRRMRLVNRNASASRCYRDRGREPAVSAPPVNTESQLSVLNTQRTLAGVEGFANSFDELFFLI